MFRVAVRLPKTIRVRCRRCGLDETVRVGDGLTDVTGADTVASAPDSIEVDGCPACEPGGGPDDGETVAAE